MRLLLLDGSRLLASLVRRLVPPGVEIEEVLTFGDAMARLRERPPDAVIVNLGPADLPWRDLKSFCESQSPQIPVLFESCIHASSAEAGLGDLNHSAWFLTKPYDLHELRAALDRLLGLRGSARDSDHLLEPGVRPTRRPDR